MRLIIENTAVDAGRWAANYVADQINAKAKTSSEPFVLGLPTGSTPLETYRELIRLHKAGEVSFKNVITFNMDEYVGLEESHPESYHSFMWTNFFSHIDINKEKIDYARKMYNENRDMIPVLTEEIERLKNKKVFSLKCNEIEMLLLDEAIFKKVLRQIFKPENVFDEFKTAFFGKLNERKQYIIRFIKRHLLVYLIFLNNKKEQQNEHLENHQKRRKNCHFGYP